MGRTRRHADPAARVAAWRAQRADSGGCDLRVSLDAASAAALEAIMARDGLQSRSDAVRIALVREAGRDAIRATDLDRR